MSPLVILALRALLVVIATGAAAGQTAIVAALAVQVARSDVDTLETVYGLLGIVIIACLETGLAALWVLLSMVRREAIFDDERAFRWVRVMALAGLAAAVLVAGLCAHAGEIDDAPGLVLIGGGVGVAGFAFALLMLVMQGLLRNATVLRRELDEVV